MRKSARTTAIAALAALTTATAAQASLPPNGGLNSSITSEKDYLDQIAPDQLSNLIDILNIGAETVK